MVFKRREKRSWGSLLQFLLWPKGGWTRAALYVKHRLHRLPDNPEKIAEVFGLVYLQLLHHFMGFTL